MMTIRHYGIRHRKEDEMLELLHAIGRASTILDNRYRKLK